MAYRRSLLTRATLLTRHRVAAPFPYTHSDDDRNRHQSPPPLHRALFGAAANSYASLNPSPFSFMTRNMSTSGGGEKIEFMADVAEVLADGAADVAGKMVSEAAAAAAGPVMSEVAVAAADSAFPVAALQYFIEGVHNFSGCNWWASIIMTTLLIRGATVPLLINQLKASTKLGILRPELEVIKNEMQDKGMDPQAVADGQKQMQALFKKYGVTPFTPLKGLLIQGPVFLSFFLAISNMVEKVPSFKQGGAFWFTDLTTPDSLYIFPVLTALSFWITVEFNMQEGMEGNPAAKTMKKVSRIFAAVTIPITMNFPKALFCYWVTSNLFSLMYGAVLKAPGVKQFLNIPEIPVAPPSTTTDSGKPEFSFLESMKKYVAAQKHIHDQQTTEILSQRMKGLETQVKEKNKNKKT